MVRATVSIRDKAVGVLLRGARAVEVVVLRNAASPMGFERVINKYLHAKPNPNSLACSRAISGGSSCRGGGRCVHDHSNLSSRLWWKHWQLGG